MLLPKYIQNKKLQKGQALLLVLLAMAAILTVTLSVASRSITDVSITASEEDALRAFSAAEAGVEKALLSGSGSEGIPVQVDPSGDTTVTYASTITTTPAELDFVYPSLIYSGESATFWFVEKNASGGLTCSGGSCLQNKSQIKNICWGFNSPSTYPSASVRPAVVVSIFYDWNTATNSVGGATSSTPDFSNIKIARAAYDGYSSTAISTRGDNFQGYTSSGGDCILGGKDFAFKKSNINFNADLGIPTQCWQTPGCLLMAKVRVLYNDPLLPEQVGIEFAGATGVGLPAQGQIIESVGAAGESTRKVNVFQSFAEPPTLLDSAIFSMDDFAKF